MNNEQTSNMSKTNYVGIDYGLGKVNRDASGIRFGVISQDEVGQAWADSSEPVYPDPCCPKCGGKVVPSEEWEEADKDFHCQSCEQSFWSDAVYGEPSGFAVNDKEYSASCGDCGDIFILRAPFFTYAQFCSPCAPGACYLANPLDEPCDNNRAYCFGHDWFEGGVAPYPVYSVETGELVVASAN